MTISKYTKHYYASTGLSTSIGSERVASALGSIKSLGLLCEGSGADAALIAEMNDKVEVTSNTLPDIYRIFGKHLILTAPFFYRDVFQRCDLTHYQDMYHPYWYHPDHLGSSSYITNLDGEITQHMEYLPFGETLVEEHLNSNNSPFKFNAKELDAETGWYYYGARYYDPKWSMWLSVDPLAEFYPGWSPYSYVYNNPVNWRDFMGLCPEGDCPDDVEVGSTHQSKDGATYTYNGETWNIDGGALDEATITYSKSGANLSNSGYSKDDLRVRRQLLSGGANDPISRNLLLNEQRGIFRPLYDPSKPYEGFAEEYATGASNAGELAEFWMNATAYGVGIPLLAGTVGSYATLRLGTFSLSNVGIETTTELLSTGLRPGDMNMIAIGASAFGGNLGARAVGARYNYSLNRGFRTYELNRAILNFGIGKANSGVQSLSNRLMMQSFIRKSGFARAYIPSLSIGVQSSLKAASNQ